MDNINNDLIEVKEKFISFLKEKGYKESSLKGYVSKINLFYIFLNENKLSLNKDSISLYLKHIEKLEYVEHTKSQTKSIFTRFSDFIDGDEYVLLHPYNQIVLPSISIGSRNLLNRYIRDCIENGNKEATIKHKKTTLTRFLSECEKRTLNINSLNSSHLSEIMTYFFNGRCNHWPIISNFLLYLFKAGYIENNLSSMIPKSKSKQIIPTVYSTDEIKKIEDSIESSTFKGKRDKAALLLASRLGVRVSDIVNLELNNFDFKNNQLSFIQVKTDNPISLPIVNDLKEALLDYIKEREKINTSSNKLFIRTRLPFDSLKNGGALDYALNEYFKKAGIDTSNKKHGLHSLRSSLASSMVNDEVPYDIVRKVLGHNDSNAIKHYARLDIEELRKCALEVPPPSGRFEAFLKGGLLTNE